MKDLHKHSTAKVLRKNFRDKWLKGQGYKVLRFWNNEVLTNIEGVLEIIRNCLNHPPLTPPLLGESPEATLKGGEIKGVLHQGEEILESSSLK